MSARGRRILAFWLSVIGHALIVVALTFSIPLSPMLVTPGEIVIPIDTVMIDQSALDAQMAALEAARQEEIRQEQARVRQERLRQVEEQRQRDQALRIAEQQRQAEQDRLERIEREQREAEERAAEERRRQEAAEEAERQAELARQREAEALRRRQEAAAAEVARAVADEQAARAAADSGLRAQWGAAIARKVEQYWQRPPNATIGLECVLVVTQLTTGDVTGVSVDDCNVNDANIIRSLENAVTSASPLPPRPPAVAFERIIRIRFKPTE